MTITTATEKDYHRLYEIFTSTLEEGSPVEDLESEESFVERIAQSDHVWIAREGDVTVGFLAQEGNDITFLYVIETFQNQGVGFALLNEAKRLSSELILSIFEANKKAERFYLRNGFSLVQKYVGQTVKGSDALVSEYAWKKHSA